MILLSEDEYIREASLLLKNKSLKEIKSFFLLYCIVSCSNKIELTVWQKFKYGDDINKIKMEAITKVNKILFSDWEIKQSDYEFIKWHKIYNVPYSENDILGKIYLLYSQEKHRKRMGEHYTRIDIVKYIISQLKCDNLVNKKIIDPCCGSGNFLIEILKRDFKKCKTIDSKKKLIANIFSNNHIIGVDIQEIPCLISKIRIILEVLKNIDCLDTNYRIPIFQKDSLKENDHILSFKYDLVITNPPYLRYQLISEHDRALLRKLYKSATGRFDLYIIFIERCIQLSQKDGNIIIVTSDKFMIAEYGNELRKLIQNNNTLVKVQDLRGVFTFEASVLAAIYYIKKVKINSKIALWEKIEENDNKIETINAGIVLLGDTWKYSSYNVKKVYNKIINNARSERLKELCNISVGIQTTADKVFCEKKSEKKFIKFKIENELIYPMLRGKTINKWRVGEKYAEFQIQDRILYPYIKQNNKTKAINLNDFVNTKRYLMSKKDELKKRKYMGNKNWYEHLSPKNHKILQSVKIVTPDLSSTCQFALDEEGYFCNGTVYFIQFRENRVRNDYLYLLAILNSNVIEFMHKNINTVHLSSKKYRFQTNTMKDYPIIWSEQESSEYNKLVSGVNKILRTKKNNFNDTEKCLNEVIYSLYNLDTNDIKVIEEFINETKVNS